MCFGVRDAIDLAGKVTKKTPLTILGQLVHNEIVRSHLEGAGVQEGDLNARSASTNTVMITAHGASDREKEKWRERGHQLKDATCPLVKKAHKALAILVAQGCFPVIIGKAGHVEVEGLKGDFPQAMVVLTEEDFEKLPRRAKYGVISQTTQPIERVQGLLKKMQERFAESDVLFRDTVCQPTKNRQKALRDLAAKVDLVLVVGGENSNNSQQLVLTARQLGTQSIKISKASELTAEILEGVKHVGVTAGTSTLASCVEQVVEALEAMGGRRAA